jgi:Zn ribbon nucleic-acid-binding protein
MEVAKTKECPKCKGTAPLIVPLKKVTEEKVAAYGCAKCGHAFRSDGAQIIKTPDELRDIFRGATQGNKTLLEMFQGQDVPEATRTLFMARMVEYGLQMWNDGLKQGLLLGTLQQNYKGDSDGEESGQ